MNLKDYAFFPLIFSKIFLFKVQLLLRFFTGLAFTVIHQINYNEIPPLEALTLSI